MCLYFLLIFCVLLQEDVHLLREIERFYDTQIEEMPANIPDLI